MNELKKGINEVSELITFCRTAIKIREELRAGTMNGSKLELILHMTDLPEAYKKIITEFITIIEHQSKNHHEEVLSKIMEFYMPKCSEKRYTTVFYGIMGTVSDDYLQKCHDLIINDGNKLCDAIMGQPRGLHLRTLSAE